MDDDEDIYDRVNEVTCCQRQGRTPAETAAMMDQDLADVLKIYDNPLEYLHARGVKGHRSDVVADMPDAEQIAERAAVERAAALARKRASGPLAHGYNNADYDKPVYPRHPRPRRRSW